jgi:hypothetical protein
MITGKIERVKERVNKGNGSKNQMSWEEKIAPTKRKIRI